MTIQEKREIILSKLSEKERIKREEYFIESDNDVEKMRNRLEVRFQDLGLDQSMDALCYMYEKHADQLRKNGELYIIHPMSMACNLMAMKINDDNQYATILLHDVIEENAKPGQRLLNSEAIKMAASLPVGNTVRQAVILMTLSAAYENEPPSEMKRRYFERFIENDEPENKIALICKGLDRLDNLGTMIEMPQRNIIKNALETEIHLVPIMGRAKRKWPREANTIFFLRNIIQIMNRLLAHGLDIEDINDVEMLTRLYDDPSYLAELG